jgi:hypothetical protein
MKAKQVKLPGPYHPITIEPNPAAGMLAVFAEFERDILRERVKAGIARAMGFDDELVVCRPLPFASFLFSKQFRVGGVGKRLG